MKRLPYLLPVAALLLKRHELHALWLDQTRGILPWHIAMIRDELVLAALVAGILVCSAVLTWNFVVYELPANRRRKARP
jgi:hypothetical protein